MDNKQAISVMINDEIKDKLIQQARQEDRSLSAVIRTILKNFYENKSNKL